jgi:uncharacterized protein (DUF1684 family)
MSSRERVRRRASGVWISLAAVGWLSWGCSSGPAPVDDRPYEQQVAAFRKDKDAAFRSPTNTDSPIPVGSRATFPGLAYYPIDLAYRVPAYLTEDRSGPPLTIALQTSTGPIRKMRRVGSLGFAIGATPYKLTAFTDIDAPNVDRLFVPFGDLTSGGETYKGGRYLELERTPTGLYDLDFNRAYHPSCVFSPQFECPIPPKENRLPVAIRAGEKLSEPH